MRKTDLYFTFAVLVSLQLQTSVKPKKWAQWKEEKK